MATVIQPQGGGDVLGFLLGLKRLQQEQEQFQAEQKRNSMLSAMSVLGSVSKILPKDTPIEQATAIHPALKELGIDPASLKGSILNPSTGEDRRNTMYGEMYNQLKSSQDPADRAFLVGIEKRGISQLFTGKPLSPEDWQNEDTAVAIKKMGLTHFEQSIKNDPRMAYEVGAAASGVEASRMPVEFDYGGKHYKYDNDAAGRLALGFAEMDARRQELSENRALRLQQGKTLQVEMANVLVDQAHKYNPEINLTLPQAMRLTDAEINGKLTDKFIQDNPDIAPIAQLIRSGHMAGRGNLSLMMRFGQGGQGISNLEDITQSEWFKSLPADMKNSALEGISKKLRAEGVDFPEVGSKRGFPIFGTSKEYMQFTPVPGISTPAQAAPADTKPQGPGSVPMNGTGGQVPMDMLLQAAANIYGQTVGGTTVDDKYLAAKGFSPEQIQQIKSLKPGQP